MSDLLTLSIAEAGRQVRAGQTGFVALVQACLDRERQTRGLNAWTELYAGQALALAAGYQTLLDNGVDLGPLHGIPLGLKANIAIAGREMHAGSKLLKGNVASQDATVSQRLKQAGRLSWAAPICMNSPGAEPPIIRITAPVLTPGIAPGFLLVQAAVPALPLRCAAPLRLWGRTPAARYAYRPQ